MGGTAHAGKNEASRPQAADTGRAGCLSEFDEGKGSRRDRVRWKARGSGRRHEPGADAASRRRMEVALRCKEPAPVPLSGAAKADGRTIDGLGSFEASGLV